MKKAKKGTKSKSKKVRKTPKREPTANEIEKMVDDGEFDDLIKKDIEKDVGFKLD